MAFSGNFEALKEAAAGVAQTAAQKTRLVGVIAKNNLTILAEEDKIKKAQTELGKIYYKDYIMDEEPDEAEYLPWCDKITACRQSIEALKAEIEDAKAQLGGDGEEYEIVPVEVAYPEEAAQEPAAEEVPAEEAPVVEETCVEEAEVVVEEVPVADAEEE